MRMGNRHGLVCAGVDVEQKPIKVRCPFCKAEPGQPCKSVEGHIMIIFHRERYKRN